MAPGVRAVRSLRTRRRRRPAAAGVRGCERLHRMSGASARYAAHAPSVAHEDPHVGRGTTGGAEAVGPSGVCPAGVSKPRDPIWLTPVGAGLKVAGHAGALAQIQRPLRDQGQPVRARRLRCLCGQPMAGGGRSEPSGARLRTTSPMSAVARPPGRDTRATQRTYRHTCSLCGYLPHTWPRHGCGPGAERRGHTSRVLTTEPSQPCRS